MRLEHRTDRPGCELFFADALGFESRLELDLPARPAEVLAVAAARWPEAGLGGAAAVVLIGHQEADLTIVPGCSLHLTPVLPVVLPVQLTGVGPGGGTFEVSGPLPASMSPGTEWVLQTFIADPAMFTGYSATNGATLFAQ